jgi:hypothetical protein
MAPSPREIRPVGCTLSSWIPPALLRKAWTPGWWWSPLWSLVYLGISAAVVTAEQGHLMVRVLVVPGDGGGRWHRPLSRWVSGMAADGWKVASQCLSPRFSPLAKSFCSFTHWLLVH